MLPLYLPRLFSKFPFIPPIGPFVPLQPPPSDAMPSAVKPPQTLYDKVFLDHIVEEKEDGTVLLYIGAFASVSPSASSLLTAAQTDISSTR